MVMTLIQFIRVSLNHVYYLTIACYPHRRLGTYMYRFTEMC